ncbi:MAG: citryl-CoA lyase [Spirochaetia bacterium]|jgi:citrate synthase|nr:citryl-CoA lyase [Spirochaetia bacterium]
MSDNRLNNEQLNKRIPPWETKITEIKKDEIRIHGYRVDELMGNKSFGDMVFLMLKGELPSINEGKMMDIMLVSCIDHGVTPPSALAALTSASTGAPYNGALAAGILSINEHHGGAIENSMRMLMELQVILDKSKDSGRNFSEAVKLLITRYKDLNRKLPGFGHRIHKNDPRTAKLIDFAHEYDLADTWVRLLTGLNEGVQKSVGKELPINVDGAIAALLLELGIAPELANSFFIMARVPGLVVHIHEEKTLQKPMRRIDPVNHIYTGEAARGIEDYS